MISACYLADLMLLAINTHIYQPSLLASAYMFVALIALEEPLPVRNSDSYNFV